MRKVVFKKRILLVLFATVLICWFIICSDYLSFDEPISDEIPTIYAITPTYPRLTQKAELVRLSSTLRNIANLQWIVVEDKKDASGWLDQFLRETGLKYVYLNTLTPDAFRPGPNDPAWTIPRAVEQRNLGLNWIRSNVKMHNRGVVYFMDDDNTYDLSVFDEMRLTKRISVWPVAFAGQAYVETPVIGADNKVEAFSAVFGKHRQFPLDMAAFAINVEIILSKKDVVFWRKNGFGMLETKFLEDLGFTIADLEPKGNMCTEVRVWHTQTKTPQLASSQNTWKGGKV